ncbi:MAG: FHA domain-containing protein [Polyangiaceae bacterium]
MDQARYFVCESCMTPVPSGHKFCGRCGAGVPEAVMHLESHFFSDMQDPTKARLILIRGEGMDGLSYHLKADQHIVGRQGQVEFPDDPFVSPRHANFFYRDNRLVVRDESSVNGVYFRVRGSVEIVPGDQFQAGEQVFRLDPTPRASDGADPDGTFFYSSPKYPSAFRINQILEGGAVGMTVCARGNSLSIGREDGDSTSPATSSCPASSAASKRKTAVSRSPTTTPRTAPTCASKPKSRCPKATTSSSASACCASSSIRTNARGTRALVLPLSSGAQLPP